MKDEILFHTWAKGDEKSVAKAFNAAYQNIEESNNSEHFTQSSDIYRNIESNISVRDGFNRRDYDYFREDERSGDVDHKEIKRQCRKAYRKNGLIRNIVDLMSDFTVQGMRIVHPVDNIQRFLETWADKVSMINRAERQANNLIKAGCYALNRTTAKLNKKDVENFKKNLVVGADIKAETEFDVEKNTIPYKYKFLNPATIDVIGEDLSILTDSVLYGVQIPSHLVGKIKSPKTNIDKELVLRVPVEWVNSIRRGEVIIPLNPESTVVDHYKKDDYELWADSMLYAVLDDINMLNKMKLADLTALDGIISHVRLWRLGSLEHQIVPSPTALAKLSDVLINNVAGGCVDLVWGPELDFKETSTDSSKFLGSEKYAPVLNLIYAGLGIPPTLTGGANASGTTNNFISLKTLLERLNYIRTIIVRFWNNELRRIQKAMGFAKPAWVVFDKMTLVDEVAEKKLILDMVDRNIISVETAQERLGEDADLEELRIRKEGRRRDKGKLPNKAGPYYDSQHKEALQKIALQGGVVAPSEVGLELDQKKKGEIRSVDIEKKQQALTKTKLPGTPGQGRPKSAKDKTKRKKKRVLPRTATMLTTTYTWARKAQSKIADYLDKTYVKAVDKENMRQLSEKESEELEDLKQSVLCYLNPGQEVTDSMIEASLDAELSIPINVTLLQNETVKKYREQYNRQVNLDEMRQIQAMCYVFHKGDFNGKDDNNS